MIERKKHRDGKNACSKNVPTDLCTEKWMDENSVGRRNDGTGKQQDEKMYERKTTCAKNGLSVGKNAERKKMERKTKNESWNEKNKETI